jgi:hypothetical protein
MGLKPQDFWNLTLKEWNLTVKGYVKREERLDKRTAMICATLWNVNGGKNGKPLSPEDFMPKKRKPQTPEEMLNIIKMHNQIHGGKEG